MFQTVSLLMESSSAIIRTMSQQFACTICFVGGCKEKKYILEWTENFDVYQLNNGKIIYYNLKMICNSGGGQMRALREVYHFIMTQKWSLKNIKIQMFYF